MKQAKAGDSKLRNAWEKAKAEGSQQAKRDFYYHVFLLDPNVSKKECHKTSLERLQETEKSLKGWMTSFQIAKLQGADPQDPRYHEVKAWADMGTKQYRVAKQMATEEARVRESTTAAHQSVSDLDTAEFQQVERALMAKPAERQVLLGSKKSKPEKATAQTMEEEPEKAPETAEEYKEAYKGASCTELESLEKGYSKSKSDLLKELSMFKDTLDQPKKGSELIQQLLDKKKACEDEIKSLNKAVNSHKLWAKNAKLI
eukprot:s3841_g2.t1